MSHPDRKILITGSGGFIGSTCIRTLAERGDYSLICPPSSQLDVSSIESVEATMSKYRPDTVINFAAHRNANTAELQKNIKNGSAWMTNVVGAENLVETCQIYGSYLLQISSDMVFSGKRDKKGPYAESDLPEDDPNNLSWYGWTKRVAEKSVASYGNSCIVRIGNVTKPIYDWTLDFIGKILWSFDTGNSYPLFNDQWITLTCVSELVQSLMVLVDSSQNGIQHVSCDNIVTPYELTEYLLSKSRNNKYKINTASVDDYLNNHPNRYPKWGGLKSKSTQARLGEYMPWQAVVDYFIKFAT